MAKFVSTAGLPRDVVNENPEMFGWWGSLKTPPKEYEIRREAEARRNQRKKLKRTILAMSKGRQV